MTRTFVLFCIIIIFASCKETTREHGTYKFRYNVDIERQDKISVFDLFSDIEVIPLETKKECLLAWGTPQIYKDKIYILENRQNIVFCFDIKGKFLYKIDNIGRGPQEYQALWGLVFDNYNDRIILVETSGTVHEYTLEGNFIRKINCPNTLSAVHKVEVVNKDTILYYTKYEPQKIHFYSRKENKIIKSIYTEREQLNFMPNFYHYEGRLYMVPCYQGGNTFDITDLQLSPYCFWDFGKYDYNPEKIKYPKINQEEWEKIELEWRLKNCPYGFVEAYENKRICYLRLNLNYTANIKSRIPPRQTNLLYDKSSGKYYIFDDFVEKIDLFTISMDDQFMNFMMNYSQKESLLDANILKDSEKRKVEEMKEDDNMQIIRLKFNQDKI